jgi:hypothetical protein
MSLKEFIKERKEQMNESRVYNKEVNKRNLAERRRAYAEESQKQAAIQGRELAIKKAQPKPSFGESFSHSFGNVSAGHGSYNAKPKMVKHDEGFGWISGSGTQKVVKVKKRKSKPQSRRVVYVKPRRRKAVKVRKRTRVVYERKPVRVKKRKHSAPQSKSWLGNLGLNEV